MRPLETSLVAVIGLAALVPVLFGRRLRRGVMAIALAAAALAQVLVEGPRWQMVPVYVAAAATAIGDIVSGERRPQAWPRIRRALLGVPGLALLLVLPLALPVPSVPEPTGPFPVGTASFEIVDSGREEVYAGLEGRSRRFMAQVWYPAGEQAADGPVVSPWIEDLDVVGPALSRQFGFPGFLLSHTRYTDAYAHPGAEPVSGTVPVVIYSHGWRGFRNVAVNQLESLASHGFFVVAVDHTYGSVAVQFPDGAVAELDESALPDQEEVGEEAYDEATELLVETYSGDIITVLDRLAEGSQGTFGELAEMADMRLVGIYGHSTGGGAAVRTCLVDDRCTAVLGLDAWVEPISRRELARELQVPSLFLRSDGWRGTPNDGLLRGVAERSPSYSYWVGLEGAGHQDFVLPPSFTPVATQLGLKGPIPAERAIELIDRYLVAFFSQELFGFGGDALDRPPPPEVELEYIP